MGDKYVATVRFHTEGRTKSGGLRFCADRNGVEKEAELYQRLIDGKKEAGLSVPDYIKQILTEYFAQPIASYGLSRHSSNIHASMAIFLIASRK